MEVRKLNEIKNNLLEIEAICNSKLTQIKKMVPVGVMIKIKSIDSDV
jgi:hypothetical protein